MPKLKTETDDGTTLIEIRNSPDGVIMQPSYVGYLKSQGYQIRDIKEVHTVESSSRDIAHLVMHVATYPFPRGSPLLDVGDENQQISVWVCSCESFRYHESADIAEDISITPDDCGRCRHIQDCSMVQRAQEDDKQTRLGQ